MVTSVDDVDRAAECIQRRIDEGIARARAKPPEKGHPGDCDLCGEWSGRLVLGACASCRERYKIV